MASLKIICYGCAQKLDVSELKSFTRLLCPVCSTKLTVPKKFGNFLLEEIIGEGDLAVVYRAMDLTLDREIAVKVLKEEFACHPDLPHQYMNEARMASAINHPNVIPIYSCGESQNQPYLIMQFMPGGSLKSRINVDKPASPLDASRWFMEAAKGLDSAALHGMLHYNLTPSNIFLDLDNNVKIGDFGLVRSLIAIRPILHNGMPNVNLRQARYFAPERLNTGRQEVLGDIYSFGASFYHVLTGRPPYEGDQPDAVLSARKAGMPVAPETLVEGLPPRVAELMMAMLEPQPSMRPKTYTEIVLTLKQEMGGLESRFEPRRADGSAPPARFMPPSHPAPGQASPLKTKVITMDEDGDPHAQESTFAMRMLTRVAIPVLLGLIVLLTLAWLAKGKWYPYLHPSPAETSAPAIPPRPDSPDAALPATSQ